MIVCGERRYWWCNVSYIIIEENNVNIMESGYGKCLDYNF